MHFRRRSSFCARVLRGSAVDPEGTLGEEEGEACEAEKYSRTSSKNHERLSQCRCRKDSGGDDPSTYLSYSPIDCTCALLDDFVSRFLYGVYDRESSSSSY